MRVTMVKKKLRDGSTCRKCQEAEEHLAARGLLDRIDEVVWAVEGDPASPGERLGQRLGVERAPFFVVCDDAGSERVYTSVLRLVKEVFNQELSSKEAAASIDPDEVGGI